MDIFLPLPVLPVTTRALGESGAGVPIAVILRHRLAAVPDNRGVVVAGRGGAA